MTEQRQVLRRAVPRLKNLDPAPSHSLRPVNSAQSNIAADAAAALCSCSSPVTSGGWHPAGHNYDCPATVIPPAMRGVSPVALRSSTNARAGAQGGQRKGLIFMRSNTSVPSFPCHAPNSTLCCSREKGGTVRNTSRWRSGKRKT